MQFKKDAEVVSAEGEKIGSLDRVVMDPKTREVAYLVVRSGFLLPEDKLIPIGMIRSADQKHIEVKASRENLQEFLRYEAEHYVPSEHHRDAVDDAETYYWYPPAFGLHSMGQYPPFAMIPVTSAPRANPDPASRKAPPVESESPAAEKNVPEDMVALKEGAKVLSRDGKHVGEIDRVLIDEHTNHVTHLVISHGAFLKEKKMVPAYWLSDASEDEVHLVVESDYLHKLPDYHSEK